MKREELPNEASREDKMREALAHYEELATKACWHRSDIPEAIRAYYAPFPPAEGAEEFLKQNHISGADFVYTTGFKNMVALVEQFATLHAQRLAEKMVEEKLIEFGNMIRDEPNGDIPALAEYFTRTINLKSRE